MRVVRILHTVTYYHPHWTGLTKYAQRLAEGLAGRGHQVSVLTARHTPELARAEVVNGVAVHRLAAIARVSRGLVMPFFPVAARALISKHDVVTVHTPMLETWLVAALARRLGRPCVVVDHGDLVMPAGPFNQLVQWSVRGLMVKGLEAATVVTTHTEDYAQHSEFLWPFREKLRWIFPPVDIPVPRPEGVQQLRERLNLNGAPVVGFAGRFVEEKGFDYLLQAMPLVAARIPDVRFVYAGDPNVAYEDFYKRWAHLFEAERAAGRLIPLGLLHDPQDLADFYALCDVFAIPSRTDCFPSVQVEVMMSGTPVVTADIPGARVAVQVTEAGLLVAAQDPRALADGLVRLLKDPKAYVRPRSDVEAILGAEQSVSEYEDLYRDLLRGASAADTS
jgi:glycosyltransferase involved in cell wall biosynthesis